MEEQSKILIVDDSLLIRNALSAIMEDEGYQVTAVASGTECLEQLPQIKPDLILLDVVMPIMDGFDVCIQIKENQATKDIPVIFVTGLDDHETLMDAFRVGGVDYIVKPVSDIEVVARVSSQLRQHRAIRNNVNLLKINQLMIAQMTALIDEFPFLNTITSIKDEISENSNSLFDILEEIRANIAAKDTKKAVEGLSNAEFLLQFTDRMSQQINEMAKFLLRLQRVIEQKHLIPKEYAGFIKASTNSVLNKATNQKELDNLLKDLNI